MRILMFYVPDDTPRHQIDAAAICLGCSIEEYFEEKTTTFRQQEQDEAVLPGGNNE